MKKIILETIALEKIAISDELKARAAKKSGKLYTKYYRDVNKMDKQLDSLNPHENKKMYNKLVGLRNRQMGLAQRKAFQRNEFKGLHKEKDSIYEHSFDVKGRDIHNTWAHVPSITRPKAKRG